LVYNFGQCGDAEPPPEMGNFNMVDDGLEYILGFIARKFNKQLQKKGVTAEKRLGDFSYKKQWDHDYCVGGGYVEQLSSGSLR
jgi:87kDa Transposase